MLRFGGRLLCPGQPDAPAAQATLGHPAIRDPNGKFSAFTDESLKPVVSGHSKPAIPTAGNSGRQSHCEPFRGLIQEKAAADLSTKRIYHAAERRPQMGRSFQRLFGCAPARRSEQGQKLE